jgi:hypothetical protein
MPTTPDLKNMPTRAGSEEMEVGHRGIPGRTLAEINREKPRLGISLSFGGDI